MEWIDVDDRYPDPDEILSYGSYLVTDGAYVSIAYWISNPFAYYEQQDGLLGILNEDGEFEAVGEDFHTPHWYLDVIDCCFLGNEECHLHFIGGDDHPITHWSDLPRPPCCHKCKNERIACVC